MKGKILLCLFVGIPAFIGLAVAFQALPDWGKSAVQCSGMLLAVLLVLLILTGNKATDGNAGQQGGGGWDPPEGGGRSPYQPPGIKRGDCPSGCSGVTAETNDQARQERMAAARAASREEEIDRRVEVLSGFETDWQPLPAVRELPEPRPEPTPSGPGVITIIHRGEEIPMPVEPDTIFAPRK